MDNTPVRTYKPSVTFNVYAYCKLLWLRDRGNTEVGFYGICRDPKHPLYVDDIRMVRQSCTSASVKFDPEAVADFFDDMAQLGLQTFQYARLWMHTHPGASCQPSHDDEDTFSKSFSHQDWAVMFILGKTGDTYARLRMNSGMGVEQVIPVYVDYKSHFDAADHAAWQKEYDECWQKYTPPVTTYVYRGPGNISRHDSDYGDYHGYGNYHSYGVNQTRGFSAGGITQVAGPTGNAVTVLGNSARQETKEEETKRVNAAWNTYLADQSATITGEEGDTADDYKLPVVLTEVEKRLVVIYAKQDYLTEMARRYRYEADLTEILYTDEEAADITEDQKAEQQKVDDALVALAEWFEAHAGNMVDEERALFETIPADDLDEICHYSSVLDEAWRNRVNPPPWFAALRQKANMDVLGMFDYPKFDFIAEYAYDHIEDKPLVQGDAECRKEPVLLPAGLSIPAALLKDMQEHTKMEQEREAREKAREEAEAELLLAPLTAD